MKYKFITDRNINTRLILIFAGWSSDYALYKDCVMTGWDTVVIYDYDDLSIDTSIFNKYSTIYLYAWSLGVAAATKALKDIDITAAFAINGTPIPVDDLYGIPTAIFRATHDNLNARQLAKFRRRMVDTAEEFTLLSKSLPQEDDIDSLRAQLSLFINTDFDANYQIDWKRVYIGGNDKIFSCKSQSDFWKQKLDNNDIVYLDAPHYYPVVKIIKSTIHDLSRVAARFQKALPSYNDNATAQHKIISNLCEMLKKKLQHISYPADDEVALLEIGPGSGAFTAQYSKFIDAHTATFIDLYKIKRPGFAKKEDIIIGDAEDWIGKAAISREKKFNYILSSSAIQWFVDLPAFFKHSASILKNGGILGCSTFIKGNLNELTRHNTLSMFYYSAEELENIAHKYFEEVEVVSEKITLSFPSYSSMLKHILLTGVGGSAEKLKNSLSSKLESHNPPYRLTYCPAYIICSSPKR